MLPDFPADFPAIELVGHIPMEEHPWGRYVVERNRIELSAKELGKRTPEERCFAVHHELGHWFAERYIPAATWQGPLSPSSAKEHFSDSFALYFTNPDKLSSVEYLYFTEALFKIEEAVRAAAEEATVNLERNL